MTSSLNSNLSKIKPKFRTEGQITGNWGRPKVRTHGNTQLGFTTKENITVTTQDDYLARMYQAFDRTDDPKMKKFIYSEIRKIMVQRGLWTD